MNKPQIIIIHGGDHFDSHEEHLQYLREKKYDPYEVRGKGWKQNIVDTFSDRYDVIMPTMPCKQNAKYDAWEIWFEKMIPYLRDNVILIGSSLGGHFLVQYLSEKTLPIKIRALHLAAPCFCGGGGFIEPADLSGVTQQVPHITLYQSTDDPIVPFTDSEKYQVLLPQAERVIFSDRGHFLGNELPELFARL